MTRREVLGNILSGSLLATVEARGVPGWCSVHAAAIAPDPTVDLLMRNFMKHYSVPGASIAFQRGAEVLYSAGYGMAVESSRVPVTVSSRFRIASNSKAFTSAAIFTLIEASRLQLSSRVFGAGGVLSHFHTETLHHRELLESITVHHLLTHTSGAWKNDRSDPMFQWPQLNQNELIEEALKMCPIDYIPGKHYAYSNFGYCLLGRVIEKITGTPYAQYMQEHVLAKIPIEGMMIARSKPALREAHYYTTGEDGDPYGMPITRMDSNGGWIATSMDQARFMAALFAVQDAPREDYLISPESLKLMTTATAANPRYACGLAVDDAGNAWHAGSLPGTTSLMVHTRTGVSWSVTLNIRNNESSLAADLDRLMWVIGRSVPAWKV